MVPSLGRLWLVVYMDREGHLRLADPWSHWGLLALELRLHKAGLILNVLALLLCLLDHTVQLLLRHADHGEFSHLGVSD